MHRDQRDHILKEFERDPKLFSLSSGRMDWAKSGATGISGNQVLIGNRIIGDTDFTTLGNEAPEIQLPAMKASAPNLPVKKSSPSAEKGYQYDSWKKPTGPANKPVVEGKKVTYYKPPAKKK